MSNIKIKENKIGTIKTINKSIVNTQKMKDNLIQVKEKTKETSENEFKTEKEYAIDKVSTAMKNTPNSEINNEYISKITNIQANTQYDEYDINSNRAEWKDILAIYVAKISNGNNETEVKTLADEKVQTLKAIFCDMNNISSSTKKITKQITTTDDVGNTKIENKEQNILHITITSKSSDKKETR
mgnify:CR=1 FL=1